MGDVNIHGMGLFRVMARVSVRYLGRCTGLIGFHLELWSGCDVNVTARLCLRFTVWLG